MCGSLAFQWQQDCIGESFEILLAMMSREEQSFAESTQRLEAMQE